MMKQYVGKQTRQARENFPFTMPSVHMELIHAIAEVKKAAAQAHAAVGKIDASIKDAIGVACDEIVDGQMDNQFTLPALQGGAGTSMNMSVNEVVAARATELLQKKHKGLVVHPNDHVNKSQSTNDVNPTALKIACLRLGQAVVLTVDALVKIFERKSSEFAHIHKLGRTHIQDAVPITLGEEFASWAATLARDNDHIQKALGDFHECNLGGTAVGNAINASSAYRKAVYQRLSAITKLTLRPGKNLMSPTSSQTDFCLLSQALVLLTLDASKIASDMRLLSSGPRGGLGELKLTELQPGSSIMPGKVNPILPESVNQLYFLVSGNNLTIEHAAHASQLELGVMFPILADRLISSLKITRDVLDNFGRKCVATIVANTAMCTQNLERSTAYATLLTPTLGYDTVSALVKEAIKTGTSIRELVLEKKLLTQSAFNAIVGQK